MEEGKVSWDRIGALLASAPQLPGDVVLGPSLGEDAALLRLGGEEIWAVASDPITFASRDAGRLAVLVNANDVAVRGAQPRFFTATVLLAPDSTEDELERIFAQIHAACDRLGAWLVGGHTEVTPGLPRTIIAGTMLGRVTHRPITTAGLRPGDRVGLTKHAGLEGTAILVGELGHQLRAVGAVARPGVPEEMSAGDWLSILPEATIASASSSVSALHDVTEGGVAEALHELARASGCWIEVDEERIPLLDQTRAICAALSLDPLGLIGSGAMLVGCADEGSSELAARMAADGIPLTWIGEATQPDEHTTSSANTAGTSLGRRFPRDELVKLWLMEGIEAVLFDLDGTLVDSPYDWAALRRRLSVAGESIIDQLNQLEGAEARRRWALLEDAERTATERATLHGEANELLELLERCGLSTALVTNNTDRNTRALLERFALRFDVVLTRDSGLHKPSAAPVTEALQQLGKPPARCLAVGDSRHDVASAWAAGCARIAVVNRPRAEWQRWPDAGRVDLCFDNIAALRRYLTIVLEG